MNRHILLSVCALSSILTFNQTIFAAKNSELQPINSPLNQNLINKTSLCSAAWLGHEKTVEKILSKKSRLVNTKDLCGFTPLAYSCFGGHLTITKNLVKSGAKLDTSLPMGIFLLGLAAQKGKNNIISFLLTNKVNIHQRDIYGKTALMIAIQYGQIETVKELIKQKANINIKDYANNTLLHCAALYGQTELFKLLIERYCGKYSNTKNAFNQTPLHLAVISGNLTLVQEIVNLNGIEVNVSTEYPQSPMFKKNYGDTPLTLALACGRLDIAQTLIEAGAKLSSKLLDHATVLPPVFGSPFDIAASIVKVFVKDITFEYFAQTYLNNPTYAFITKTLLGLDKTGEFTKQFTNWCKEHEINT